MTSFERANAMQAFLEQALAQYRLVRQTVLPADATAPVHVVQLLSESEGDAIWVIFAVSQFNAFMPMAITDFAPGEVGGVMLAAIAQLQRPQDWDIGAVMAVVGCEALAAQDIGGLVFLHPQTTGVLSALDEETVVDGELFAPRLALFLKADELAQARRDLWGMLDRFDQTGRDVFLLYQPPTDGLLDP